MSEINWFPGHMAVSGRLMREYIKQVDAVVYVLDMRAPLSCTTRTFQELIGQKPIIYALNKAEMTPTSHVKGWTSILSTGNNAAVAVTGYDKKSVTAIVTAIKNATKNKAEKYAKKGLNPTVRVMVVGVPNTGKSTIINSLAPRAKLVTGNKPGVTRGVSWVKIQGNIELLDTPGTLEPKLANQTIAQRLACIGSVRDEIFDVCELAVFLAKEINALDPKALSNRYGDDDYTDPMTVLQLIAEKRNFKVRGGEADIEHSATALIDDFRKGRLGKICLEPPETAVTQDE